MAEGLDTLERWMQELVTHPAGPEAGAATPAARGLSAASIDEVFLPSRELTSAERVGIYAGMYFERLIEVLSEEFAACTFLVGSAAAHELFRAYLVAHPSRHYNLNRLGAGFAAFLCDEAQGLEPRAFAAELARLERCIQDVFDAPESGHLGAAEIAALPAERWMRARLVPIPAFALLAFAHPVNAWYQSFRDDELRPPPGPQPSWIAVYRREGRVWRMDLEREQHVLLEALAAGRPLGEALAGLPGQDLARIAARLQGWFRTWAAEGFFLRVDAGD